MIHINGHWETVDTLEDIARVVREYYNPELADKMDYLLEQTFDAFTNKIEELAEQINPCVHDDWDDDDEWYED